MDSVSLTHIITGLVSPPWQAMPSRDVARLLGVSLQSLANWRVRDTGPPVEPRRKGQGNRTYYRPDKLLAWLVDGQLEPWQVCEVWLRERGIEIVGSTREGVEWMIEQLEPQFSALEHPRRMIVGEARWAMLFSTKRGRVLQVAETAPKPL